MLTNPITVYYRKINAVLPFKLKLCSSTKRGHGSPLGFPSNSTHPCIQTSTTHYKFSYQPPRKLSHYHYYPLQATVSQARYTNPERRGECLIGGYQPIQPVSSPLPDLTAKAYLTPAVPVSPNSKSAPPLTQVLQGPQVSSPGAPIFSFQVPKTSFLAGLTLT